MLSAIASSNAGYRTNTTSLALQRYTYTGTTTEPRTFGGTLTYDQEVSDVFPGDIGGGVLAEREVRRGDIDAGAGTGGPGGQPRGERVLEPGGRLGVLAGLVERDALVGGVIGVFAAGTGVFARILSIPSASLKR